MDSVEEKLDNRKTVRISIRSQLQLFRARGDQQQQSTSPKLEKSVPGLKPSLVRKEDEVQNFASKVNEIVETNLDNSSLVSDNHELKNEEIVNPESTNTLTAIPICEGSEDVEELRSNIIRPIDRTVVHQICSGQVIVTLSTAVKELVENSIDAGATKIDIRLIEYGSKLVEVCDDACGISETNFEGLALKHHTSKISEFEDLESLSTFGFRGEALSSLCALSDLSVITRYKGSDQKVGHKIEYAKSGRISSRTKVAREYGTTVILKDLFHTLPVRQTEFLKNLKREFHRMVNILYGYCLVVSGVRLSCTNQVGNGGLTKVMAVPAYNTMRERIAALFGSKQLSSLIEIKQCESLPEEILSEFDLTDKTYERKYEIDGFISQPNQGRSSNDRQFYFINSRPCDPAKISRVINEVYHSFSRSQNPFVCLHIKTNRENVDVNVTPDKRTLYVQNEKILLATLKATLIPLLTAAASSYNSISSQSQSSFLNLSRFANSQSEGVLSQSQSNSSCDLSTCEGTKTLSSPESQNIGFDRQFSRSSGRNISAATLSKTNSFLKKLAAKCSNKSTENSESGRLADFRVNKRSRESWSEKPAIGHQAKFPKVDGRFSKFESNSNQDTTSECMEVNEDFIEMEEEGDDNAVIVYDDEDDSENDIFDENIHTRVVKHVTVDWKTVATKFASMHLQNEICSTVSYARRFRAKISPEDNNAAEDELKKQLTKSMFKQMGILGQFNLGFIVVKYGPDLFLVDQHASDEKFNFEDLEKSTTLESQPMIHPLDLQLPAISENIIIENIEVFRRNGFNFIISPDEIPTRRVKLSTLPYSKNTEFGKSDVEELIFMMEDASDNSFYRPTKVRQMFASRACRKSVMIGTALNLKEMRTVVDHMGDMDQPWNCPHGRPTIRHLINLNLLPDVDYTKFNH